MTASISNLKFPTEYETAVEESIIAAQNVSTKAYEMSNQQVLADTYIASQSRDTEMVLQLASAEGEEYYGKAQAIANSLTYSMNVKQQAVSALSTNMGFVDDFKFSKAEKVLHYFWIYLQLNSNMNVTAKYINAIKSYQLTKIENKNA